MSIFVKTIGKPEEQTVNYYVTLFFGDDDMWDAIITDTGWDGTEIAHLGPFATKQLAEAAASVFIRDTIEGA